MVMKSLLVLSNSLFLKNFFRVYIKVTNNLRLLKSRRY